jgi:hypothetical protein
VVVKQGDVFWIGLGDPSGSETVTNEQSSTRNWKGGRRPQRSPAADRRSGAMSRVPAAAGRSSRSAAPEIKQRSDPFRPAVPANRTRLRQVTEVRRAMAAEQPSVDGRLFDR